MKSLLFRLLLVVIGVCGYMVGAFLLTGKAPLIFADAEAPVIEPVAPFPTAVSDPVYNFAVTVTDLEDPIQSITYEVDGSYFTEAYVNPGGDTDLTKTVDIYPPLSDCCNDTAEHTLTITATDILNNTTTYNHNFTIDDQSPPTASFTISTEGAVADTGVVEYLFTRSDDFGVLTIQYAINGGSRTTIPPLNFTEYYLELPASGFAENQEHTLTIYLNDSDNERSYPFVFYVVPDTSNPDGPTIYFDRIVPSTFTTPTFTADVTAVDTADPIQSITYQIDDGSVVSGTLYTNGGSDTATAQERTLNLNLLSCCHDGQQHTLTVTASDTLANSNTYTKLFTVSDSAPPSVTPVTVTDNAIITLGDPIDYSFDVDDLFNNEQVEYEVDGGGRISVSAEGTPNPPYTRFSFSLDSANYDDGIEHTVTVYFSDGTNETSTNYTFTVDSPGDDTPPVISFTSSDSGPSPADLVYEGTAEDAESNVVAVEYSIDGGDRQNATAVGDAVFNSPNEEFSIEFTADAGPHTIVIYARDSSNNESSESFDITVDTQAPTCSADWENVGSPIYSNTYTQTAITCTDNIGITSANYTAYHVILGTVHNQVAIAEPDDGSYGGTTEDLSFSFTLPTSPNHDGLVEVTLRVSDAAGNQSYDLDPVVFEYADQTAPVLTLDDVTPDPTIDTTPTLTGSCADNTDLETNTNIADLEYRLNGGSWNSFASIDEIFDETTELFSYEIPAQAVGEYTVNVRCTDEAGQSTTATDTFEIEAPPGSATPGEYAHTDSFVNRLNQDIPNTNLIWGNGRLRLKEDISLITTLLDEEEISSEYQDRYYDGRYDIAYDSLNQLIYYLKGNTLARYNPSNDQITNLNWADFGLPTANAPSRLKVTYYDGDVYVWVTEAAGFFVVNITDQVGIQVTSTGGLTDIVPDTERGRFGAYYLKNSGAGTRLGYWDSAGTFADIGDDSAPTVTVGTDGATNAVRGLLDADSNVLYVAFHGYGVYKYFDNNTPTNGADNQVTLYDQELTPMALLLDPDGKLLFAGGGNDSGKVYVVTDLGGTEFDESDDTVVQLTTPRQVNFDDIFGLSYLEGEDGVGDQLIIQTERSNIVYLNFNDTYDDTLDDTVITLNVTNGQRPAKPVPVIIDYNTLYVNTATIGFQRVELLRGWVDSGQAVGTPSRPTARLVINNFVAEAEVLGTIAGNMVEEESFLQRLSRRLLPQAYAAENGITYFVSTDDGQTWSEISLGDLLQLSDADYRVKFKIEMTEQGGATPVLDSYTLSYAGYTDEIEAGEVATFSVSPSPTTVQPSSNFGITVTALDALGYRVLSYNGTPGLALLDSNSNATSGLFNTTAVSLSSGVGTVSTAQISQTGTYRVRATDGSVTGTSGLITVSNAVSTVPTLSLSLNKSTVRCDEPVVISWSSSNLTTLSLNHGIGGVSSSGSVTKTFSGTSTIEITGSGTNGSLTASQLLTVSGGNCSVSASPTPSPSARPILASYPASPGDDELSIQIPADQQIPEGKKAVFSWIVKNADEVFIDYLGEQVSSEGSFEFYPTEDTIITVTARRGNEEKQASTRYTIVRSPLSSILPEPWQPLIPILRRQIPEWFGWLPGAVLGTIVAIQTVIAGSLAIILQSAGGQANFSSILHTFRLSGVIPYKKRKGYVYGAKSGEPVPFAIISVKQAERLLATIISDVEGFYTEPHLAPATYVLDASHPEHHFPTKLPRPNYLTTKEYYKGEQLPVLSARQELTVLVPMDPQATTKTSIWFKLAMVGSIVLSKLRLTVIPMAILAWCFVVLYPSVLQAVIVVVYTILVAVLLWELWRPATVSGRATRKPSGVGIPDVVISLLQPDGSLVALTKTDSRGYYKFYVKPGTYQLHVTHPQWLWGESQLSSQPTITVRSTPMHKNLQLNPAPAIVGPVELIP